jgi:hypothetical protein
MLLHHRTIKLHISNSPRHHAFRNQDEGEECQQFLSLKHSLNTYSNQMTGRFT